MLAQMTVWANPRWGLDPGCPSELTQGRTKGQAFISAYQSVIGCGPPRKGL